MIIPPFSGRTTRVRRVFWDQLHEAVGTIQKIAGKNVTISEHPGKGTIINANLKSVLEPDCTKPITVRFDGVSLCANCFSSSATGFTDDERFTLITPFNGVSSVISPLGSCQWYGGAAVGEVASADCSDPMNVFYNANFGAFVYFANGSWNVTLVAPRPGVYDNAPMFTGETPALTNPIIIPNAITACGQLVNMASSVFLFPGFSIQPAIAYGGNCTISF